MTAPGKDRATAPRKANATGRSGAVLKRGRKKAHKVDGPWQKEPLSLIDSNAYRALNFPALKILNALKVDHLRHGGSQNGRLLAPHAQLRRLGISARHVRPAIDLLIAVGIVRRTSEGSRQGGREGSATYALTWLPTFDGEPPTNDFLGVSGPDAAVVKAEQQEARRLADGRAAQRKMARKAM
jgi:hypothetical protein